MRTETEPTEASQQYAAAYTAHYTGHDLPLALKLYRTLMASHPNVREAGYARTQVQNIVNAVVPKPELMESEVKLVLAHFKKDGRLDAGPQPGTPIWEEMEPLEDEDLWRDYGGQG